jgi:hypothetical protein
MGRVRRGEDAAFDAAGGAELDDELVVDGEGEELEGVDLVVLEKGPEEEVAGGSFGYITAVCHGSAERSGPAEPGVAEGAVVAGAGGRKARPVGALSILSALDIIAPREVVVVQGGGG